MRYRPLIAATLLAGAIAALGVKGVIPLQGLLPAKWQERLAQERRLAEDEVKRRETEEQTRRLTATKDKVMGLMNDTHSRMLRVIQEHRAQATAITRKYRAEIPLLSNQANKKIQGYGNALGLARRMAEDKVRGTHKTQEYLQETFHPIVRSQALAEAELHQVLKDCAASLNVESSKLQAAAAEVIQTDGFKASDLGLEDSLQRLSDAESQILRTSMSSAVATLEVAIEGLLIKTTYASISKLLASAVAKEVTSLAIGAEGAVIPVVDIATSIIAVGGTLWTAYDVHHAVDELKKTGPVISDGLADASSQLEKKINDAFASLEAVAAVLCGQS